MDGENGIWIGGLFNPSFLMRENERMRMGLPFYDPDHKTFENEALRKWQFKKKWRGKNREKGF
jgi:hypothetical protein